ncbi:MAG: glutathione S-transferase [Paracoccaceae bacterium]|jgi:glutathione S-transferase|tara:strand:+ start:472 stop:1110 length:639 start_codon:yes stop_codon:yes gene_type:complete
MTPVFYSFRRCPFAMRARLALHVSGVQVELREILLRAKPAEMIAVSAKATVPVLATQDAVIDESLDVMRWSLSQNDPEGWLDMPQAGAALIAEADGPFKRALDRTKYANRFPNDDPNTARQAAALFLDKLEQRLSGQGWLTGPAPTLADMAILPFVRQFAGIDRPWFAAQDWPALQLWLDGFLASERFLAIMHKYPPWAAGDSPRFFPDPLL